MSSMSLPLVHSSSNAGARIESCASQQKKTSHAYVETRSCIRTGLARLAEVCVRRQPACQASHARLAATADVSFTAPQPYLMFAVNM